MTRRMSKSDVRDFQRRWKLVNEREIAELRLSSANTRWRQFNALLNLARQLKWDSTLAAGESEVRNRWARLRKAHGG